MSTAVNQASNRPRLSTPLIVALIVPVIVLVLLWISAPDTTPMDLLVVGDTAYLALSEGGVRILDISLSDQPVESGRVSLPGSARQLALYQDAEGRRTLFVAAGHAGVIALDVSDPAHMSVRWRDAGVRNAVGLVLAGKTLYVADGRRGFHIYNVENLQQGRFSRLRLRWGKLWTDGTYLFTIVEQTKVAVVNPQGEGGPQAVEVDVGQPVHDLAVGHGRVYLALGAAGISWLTPSMEVTQLDATPQPVGNVVSLDVRNFDLAVGLEKGGVAIFSVRSGVPSGVMAEQIDLTPQLLVYDQARVVLLGKEDRMVRMLRQEEAVAASGEQAVITGSVLDVAVHPGGYLYLAKCEQGVQVLTFQGESRGYRHEAAGCVQAVALAERTLFTALSDGRVRVYDMTDGLETPVLQREIVTDGAARDLLVLPDMLVVADGFAGLRFVDWQKEDDPLVAQVTFDAGADAQRLVYLDGRVYVAAGVQGLQIVNVEQVDQPVREASLRLGGEVRSVAVQAVSRAGGETGRIAYLAGVTRAGQGGVWILDVSDPQQIRALGSAVVDDQPVDVAVDGRLLYVLTRTMGVRVLDISDPTTPLDVSPAAQSGLYHRLTIFNHNVYVARGSGGVVAYRFANPSAPEVLFATPAAGLLRDAVVRDGFLYAVDGDNGLWIVDLNDPQRPRIRGGFSTAGQALALSLDGERLAVADGSGGLRLYRVEADGTLTPVSVMTGLTDARDVLVYGEIAYVLRGGVRVEIVDITDLSNPRRLRGFDALGAVTDLAILNQMLYLAEGEQGVEVWDVSQPSNPLAVAFPLAEQLGTVTRLRAAPQGGLLYALSPQQGLMVLSVPRPEDARVLVTFPSQDSPYGVDAAGDYVLLADGDAGVRVFNRLAASDIYEMDGSPLPGFAAQVYGIVPDSMRGLGFLVAQVARDGQVHLFEVERKVALNEAGSYALVRGGMLSTPWVQRIRFLFLGWLLYFLAYRVFLLLASGQVLPARRLVNWQWYQQLLRFASGTHGPVVFARDGVVVQRAGEFSAQPPEDDPERASLSNAGAGVGLLFVDAVSAVVLETVAVLPGCLGRILNILRRRRPQDRLRSRAVGTGVWLLRPGERVRALIDRRRQIRVRQASARTRDGIDVSGVVFALFTLGQPAETFFVTYAPTEGDSAPTPQDLRLVELGNAPDEEGTVGGGQIVRRLADCFDEEDQWAIHRFVQAARQKNGLQPMRVEGGGRDVWRPFLYDPRRVRAAGVLGRTFNRETRVWENWTRVPMDIAVDTFRRLLEQIDFDRLYDIQTGGLSLREFSDRFRREMILQGVLCVHYVERQDGQPISEGDVWSPQGLRASEPFDLPVQHKPLRGRGIRVLHAGFTQLQPAHPDVFRLYRYNHWRSFKRLDVLSQRTEFERGALRMLAEARLQAQREMANSLLRILNSPGLSRLALGVRLFEAMEMYANRPDVRQQLPRETVHLIREMRRMLLGPGKRGDEERYLDDGEEGD